MAHDGDTSEVGASRFAAADVRRIGILDIRLFNTDRHAGDSLQQHIFGVLLVKLTECAICTRPKIKGLHLPMISAPTRVLTGRREALSHGAVARSSCTLSFACR